MRQLKITRQVTNRDTPAFEKYLQEIGRQDMISPDEEIELARLIKGGDQKALDRLVSANLRFVVSVAKQYQNQGLTLQDLVNEGNLGLIKAAKRFDETRGFKFISYAVWWIRQSILHALAVQGRMVRLPLNKIGMINKINAASSKLEQMFEREPTILEIAGEVDVELEEIQDTIKSQSRFMSMDAPLGNDSDDDFTLYDLMGVKDSVPPDNALLKESLVKEINNTLKVLGEREAQIIRMYYGLNGEVPRTLEEIGEEFDLTRERVRQLKEAAIRRLKQSTKHTRLKSYLV
ncbi:MAG: RNA polymerase sigma factor RpoD/SigA [Bacteroidales bacterium]|jgi:RNA polymerase primary sigma factor|nr:RNA polymerase sigma factor RpoD/SigA [Bacteroidales bacterium]